MDVENYSEAVTLKTGEIVTIRAVRPEDKNGFMKAFELLSEESVYYRFFSPNKKFSDEEWEKTVDVDFKRIVALVAEAETEGAKKLVGACRYYAVDENDPPRRAEVAFTVLDAWQGKGLGKTLFKHLLAIARQLGVERFEAVVLAQNKGMIKIFSGPGLAVHSKRDGGEIHFDIELS